MDVTITPLQVGHAEAVLAAEDDETVRWLSGGRSTLVGTRAYVDRLARQAEAGAGKRAFAILLDGACVGTIDFDPDLDDGIGADDVNIAYGVAPWVRGRGVTTAAVEQVCRHLREQRIGRRAAIRAEVGNPASGRVAERAGFTFVREYDSAVDTDEHGTPVRFRLYLCEL